VRMMMVGMVMIVDGGSDEDYVVIVREAMIWYSKYISYN
jgi:hypothetical protein